MNRRWSICTTQDRTDGDGHDIGQQMLPSFQGTRVGERLEMGDQRGQLRARLCHFAASMQSMSRAGSDAGPEQTEELISNLNFSGRSGVFLM
jgi:hypothetical protein